MTTRAINWLNDIDANLPAARAAGVGYVRACPSADAASNEVAAALAEGGQRTVLVDGWLCLEVTPGRQDVYQPRVLPTAGEAAIESVRRWRESGEPLSADGQALLLQLARETGLIPRE